MSLGGKRMRPVLVMLGCDFFDGDTDKALHSAIAIELFHNFTLIHDDIMDKAPLRRGKPTVHSRFGEETALLAGDVMLVTAYDELNRTDKNRLQNVIRLFNGTAKQVCEGQQLDMDLSKKNIYEAGSTGLDQYMHMI